MEKLEPGSQLAGMLAGSSTQAVNNTAFNSCKRSLSPNQVTLNVSSSNSTLDSCIVEKMRFLTPQSQATVPTAAWGSLSNLTTAVGTRPWALTRCLCNILRGTASRALPTPVLQLLCFLLFLQTPALERCQRMKKQFSKLGEAPFYYFLILRVLLEDPEGTFLV